MKRSWLVLVVLAANASGCAALRDPEFEHPPDTERTCSVTPETLLDHGDATFANGSSRTLAAPARIGLIFLPPPGSLPRAVPTPAQRIATTQAIRERLLSLPGVNEVVIVPGYFVGQGRAGDFEKIRRLSRQFDFDLVGLVFCAQATGEFRNLNSTAWSTWRDLLGAPWWTPLLVDEQDLWLGDVDQAETLVALTLIDPEAKAVVTFATGLASYGDTLTMVDDWRSPDFVRRECFERARNDLMNNLDAALASLTATPGSP